MSPCQALVPVSTAIADLLRRDLPDISDRVTTPISMGVDLERFSPSLRDPAWADRQGLTPPVILFVGRLVERKGARHLIEAMAKPQLRSAGATLAIVGDGPERNSLEALASSLAVASKVRFLGALNHEQLPTVYASADIFCLPSIVDSMGEQEGLPVVLLEANASGLPGVATTAGGTPEAVIDGECGFLVPPADPDSIAEKCATLCRDPELRTRMSKAALKMVANFSWTNVGRRYADVLTAAIRNAA